MYIILYLIQKHSLCWYALVYLFVYEHGEIYTRVLNTHYCYLFELHIYFNLYFINYT